MAEKIKRKLLGCTSRPDANPPSCLRASCITESNLTGLLQEIRGLSYGNFIEVFKYADGLDLPLDFKKELQFEAEKRGYKSNK